MTKAMPVRYLVVFFTCFWFLTVIRMGNVSENAFPGRHIPAASLELEDVFDKFFSSEQMILFMEGHNQDCRSGRTLFAGLLGRSGRDGFGSGINIALNAYFIPSEPETKKYHQFQLVTFDWIYEPLSSFFMDFAAGSNCPLFRDLNLPEADQLFSSEANLSVTWENGTVFINNTRHFIVSHGYRYEHYDGFVMPTTKKIYERDGLELFFARKSSLLKSIWQPHPNFRKLLRILWMNLLDESGKFVAVHIRRGDKITWNESADIPVSEYSDKIGVICARNVSLFAGKCPKNVFVMFDEKPAFEQLKKSLGSSFNVFDLEAIVKRLGWNSSAYIAASVNEKKYITQPVDRDFWRVHTKQIIIEITLLALSDKLICTMSSNICRLVALLRGHHQRNIFSLDGEWYPW